MAKITKKVKITGIGIHSGTPATMVIKPTRRVGIFFRRTDIDESGLISARYDNVGETKMRNTTIGNVCGAHVQTIEHLMATLFMLGISRAEIDIDGAETPILDGSANEFYNMLSQSVDGKFDLPKIIVRREVTAYATEINKTLPVFTRIKWWFIKKLTGRKSDGFVKLIPNDGKSLKVQATLVYPEKIIGRQSYEYVFDGTKKSVNVFIKDIARARTFGKYSEWEYLKSHGMARGANENNVIALNDSGDGTLNKTIWRGEFVRHKIIDAIGDMATSGGWICADLVSYKGSHALNNLVLKKLFSNPDNYDIV